MMEPKPPPSRMARASSNTFLSSLLAPPEKMTIRRPPNELWTMCFTRSARVLIGICVDSYTFLTQARPTGIGPDDNGKTAGLGFFGNGPQLLIHAVTMSGPRINRESDG